MAIPWYNIFPTSPIESWILPLQHGSSEQFKCWNKWLPQEKDNCNIPTWIWPHYSREIYQLVKLFTYGSKSVDGVGSTNSYCNYSLVGSAAACGETVRTASLSKHASVFSAELHAIQLALIIRDHQEQRFAIFTDSLTMLKIDGVISTNTSISSISKWSNN